MVFECRPASDYLLQYTSLTDNNKNLFCYSDCLSSLEFMHDIVSLGLDRFPTASNSSSLFSSLHAMLIMPATYLCLRGDHESKESLVPLMPMFGVEHVCPRRTCDQISTFDAASQCDANKGVAGCSEGSFFNMSPARRPKVIRALQFLPFLCTGWGLGAPREVR